MKAFTLDTAGVAFPTEPDVPDAGSRGVQSKTIKCYLDAAVDGPLTSGVTYPFRTSAGVSVVIPDNAIVTNVRLDGLGAAMTVGAGAATCALHVVAANDVKIAADNTAAPYDGNLSLENIMVKATAATTLTATIAGPGGSTWTAGKVIAYLDYVVSE